MTSESTHDSQPIRNVFCREILDGLHADLRHTWGTRNVASSPSSLELDIGRSQYIVDGKIKLKSGTEIKEFTEGGLTFEDGTQLQADVVLFCTGSPPFA